MKTSALLLALSLTAAAGQEAATPPPAGLKIIFIDVEGGQATLFVTPAGQSLLIDTGWPGNNGRDADRIVQAAKQAGLTRLDYVLITHFHDDHVGGVPQLAARIKIGNFIDHGTNRELDHGVTEHGFAEYQKVVANNGFRLLTPQPGEVLPLKGITATVVSGDGKLIERPLPGGGAANDACKSSLTKPADTTENGRSLGIVITYGKLRILDLGDLTWDKETELMCPTNKLGAIDILVVSHHGWYQSSSPALIYGIRPRVAVMDNGEQKGGSPATFDTFRSSPGLEALYQLHASAESAGKNRGDAFIANPLGTDSGASIVLNAQADGSFSVLNTRTKQTVTYPAR